MTHEAGKVHGSIETFWADMDPATEEQEVATHALWRPGPLETGLARTYVERRHGRDAVTFPHPCTIPMLDPTYGLLLYREQALAIVQLVAGLSPDEAMQLVHALARCADSLQPELRDRFLEGAARCGIVDLSEAEELQAWLRQWAPFAIRRASAVELLTRWKAATLLASLRDITSP